MDDTVRLCESCSKINFDTLRLPRVSDLPALQEGLVDRADHLFKIKGDVSHKSVPLGTFGDILRRAEAEACRLCQLVAEALTRRATHRPGDGDECSAVMYKYGVYRVPGEQLPFWIFRLSIYVDISGEAYFVGGPKKSLFHVFQACNVGAAAASVPVEVEEEGAETAVTDERFADRRPGADPMIFGGRRRPLTLDLGWVRRWIDICRTDHGAACELADIDPGRGLERVRFVDVERMCIVTLEHVSLSAHRYVALSYVWGGPQPVALDGSNEEAFSRPGSLAAEPLPQTLADAILLAQSLGFQHLWIDALCIVQDDDADKEIQIGAMSQIFGFAFLTIVAASAPSVHGGLPGLRPGTRSLVQQELVVKPASSNGPDGESDDGSDSNIVPGLSLMTALHPLQNPADHYLEHTPWNERGWTMQERVLSRRVLIFGAEHVYWACREATFCEESYLEHGALKFGWFHEGAAEPALRRAARWYEPDDPTLRFWKVYQKLVAAYTRRTFGYEGDVFAGFLAVLQGLSALSGGDDFSWGLPRSHFEQGLLWTSFTGLRRRRERSTLPMTSLRVRVRFPTWSWMGWIGEAFVCIGDDRCDETVGEFPEVRAFEHHHNPLRVERSRDEAAPYDTRPGGEGEDTLPGWKRAHYQPVTLEEVEEQHPALFSSSSRFPLSRIPETQIVFFWTSSCFFTLVPRDDDDNNRHYATIFDPVSGEDVGSTGSLLPPLPSSTTTISSSILPSSSSLPLLSPDGGDKGDGEEEESDNDEDLHDRRRRGRHEFIVLGSRRNGFSYPVLLVLQIEWRDGIAYRVNSGEIKEEAWERGDHAWKLIPLG